ncbi:MAG: DUF1318 domain-containing protein [Nitrospinae bacterium]|nr:DUF1318 domain-containing protein [Nitrospinota bacterium]
MMPIRVLSIPGVVSLLLLSACVTVNIYFPAKDVKDAVKSLEEELLKPTSEPRSGQEPKRKSHLQSDERSTLLLNRFKIFVVEAWAQGTRSQQINEELKGMPEVVEAYRRMGQRLHEIDGLRSQGMVGEGRDGRLTLRVDRSLVSPADSALIEQENEDREIVITGMVKAVLKINKLEASGANLDRTRPQAADLFASIRRDGAKPGWWIQLPDGTWQKK